MYTSDGANDVADQATANVSVTVYSATVWVWSRLLSVRHSPISTFQGGFSDLFGVAKNGRPDSVSPQLTP